MKFHLSKRGAQALLGLAIDGDRLEGVVARRTNGSVEIQHRFTATLALDPLSSDPELLGREIRKHLDSEEVRVRRCVVCIPAGWALLQQVSVPPIPEEDVASFLDMEAERGFPFPAESLVRTSSRFRTPGGESLATLIAIPAGHVARLQAALAAARLQPLSFTLPTPALEPPHAERAAGVMTVLCAPPALHLQITAGNGIVTLRTLADAFDPTPSGVLDEDSVLRELRITLGQLPPDLHEVIRTVRLQGPPEAMQTVARALARLAPAWTFDIQPIARAADVALPLPLTGDMIDPPSPALCLAARHLAGEPASFEFLPPRDTAWDRLLARYSSRKLVWAGGAAGILATIVGSAFLIQQARLWHWRGEWDTIATRVRELEELQENIRTYRPWFDESQRSLTILKHLTEAFPEDGSVSARTIEVRGTSTVICTGTARDRQALREALDRLGSVEQVANVRVEQINGRSPVEFTFNFQYGAGGVM